MFEQTFALTDLLSVLILSFLELSLSADNTIVISVLSHTIDPKLRKKALFVGMSSAILLRAGAIFSFIFLLKYRWIELIGAIYLIYLGVRFFVRNRQCPVPPPIESFWKTVVLIEMTDLLFAIDSIVAGIAFINSDLSKLWILLVGGIIGMIGIRFAAGFFSELLDRFPKIEAGAYLMVGWIGVKLGLSALGMLIPFWIFWPILLIFFLFGLFKS